MKKVTLPTHNDTEVSLDAIKSGAGGDFPPRLGFEGVEGVRGFLVHYSRKGWGVVRIPPIGTPYVWINPTRETWETLVRECLEPEYSTMTVYVFDSEEELAQWIVEPLAPNPEPSIDV